MERVRPQPAAQAPGRRKSVFAEVGLVDEDAIRRDRNPAPILVANPSPNRLRPTRLVRFRSTNEIFEHRVEGEETDDSDWETDSESEDNAPPMRLYATRNMSTYSRAYKLGILGLFLAFMLPIIQTNPIARVGVTGGVIPTQLIESPRDSILVKRDDTDTNICKRWSHQAAVVNGTLYVYGGRSSTDPTQKNDTWNNNFLTLDLTKSWQISNPSLTGLPVPSGPPAVANAYLYNSLDSLWLYGGEFSDSPVALPSSNSIWEYNIVGKQWYEHENPQTSAGDNAEGDGQPIQRSAEGAGFGVSTLGRGWYFGGHIDYLTTEGWSLQTPKIYLKSLIEFTFPGFPNNGVEALKDGKTAGTDGNWRNITEGGMQDTSGFTERADGLLLYVPGFGAEGLLLGLTGGVNASFTQMNVIDVYDIANSTWYKQSTSGTMPKYRVNPCAVVAAAADGSSYNVYMFGGQNLQPTGDQIQYDDMWILSIPSFKWIEVDQSNQSIPYARAGHTCNVWDGQMIIVGGYVGQELSCDSPGIYVFNMSSLSWSDQFTALTGDRALQAFTGKQDDAGNPLAQQANQRGFDAKAGLEGSYGYAVPPAVQSVIGGKETGGATLTAPVQTPTSGPLATGKPQTYTVTGPNGAIVTETSGANPSSNSGGGRGTNIGAIVAGVIAGVFFLIAGYLAFCAWIYRKQVLLWKKHAAMVAAQSRAQNGEKMSSSNNNDPFLPQGATIASSGRGSSDRNHLSTTNTSTGGRPSNEERTGTGYGGAGSAEIGRRSSEGSVSDELLSGQEPSFWGARGVLLNPRRSLKVVNKD